jgi:hypothetical protein
MIKVNSKGVFINPLEAAKATLPIFGGTTDTDTDSSSTTTTTTTDSSDSSASSSASGGSANDTATDGGSANIPTDPQQIADLLNQVQESQKKIEELTKTVTGYEKKEADAAKAAMSREEQLQADLTEAQQTIAAMDGVVRYVAAINAIQNMPDYKFHSARHVLNELDANAFDITVDLENQTATVSGIENEIKRVAKEMPWLVAQQNNNSTGNGKQGPAATRPSGAPPANPNGDADKVKRRAELMKKFPVIGQGRAAI